MKKCLDKKTFALAAVAMTLILSLGVGSAMAYFTTYATARGGIQINLGFTTTVPEETVSDWTKHIKIKNTGDRECFVRAKIFAGAQYQEHLTYTDKSGKWSPGKDGYYYYSDIVPAGGTTEELLVGIKNIKELMESTESEKDFNVIVVQECTLVIYKDGKPTADWNKVVDSSSGSYSANEGGGN